MDSPVGNLPGKALAPPEDIVADPCAFQPDLAFLPEAGEVWGTGHWIVEMDAKSERIARQQATLGGFGQRAASLTDVRELLGECVTASASALTAELAVYFEHAAASGRLIPRAGVGWSAGSLSHLATDVDANLKRALAEGAGFVIENLASDARFKMSTALEEHEARSAVIVPVRGPDAAAGLLAVFAKKASCFDDDDARFLTSISAVLGGWLAFRLLQDVDAQVSSAVAQVETEIVTALETPMLLDRLCRLTAVTLGADSCLTLALASDDNCYVVGASFARRAVDRAALQALSIPRQELKPLLESLERGPLLTNAEDGRLPAAVRAAMSSDTRVLTVFEMHRSGEPFAVQVVAISPGSDNGPRLLGIARDVSRLASTVLEYARVVDELKRVSLMKSDFVATMSHELRTPLHVIMGYNDLLLEGVLGDLTAEQSESLQQSGERTKELLALITATMDLSELEAGGMLEDVSPALLVSELERATQLIAGSPDVELQFSADPNLPMLRTDRMRLRVILENLLDNALKFTETGFVRLHAHQEGNRVQFEVSDSGIGIDAEAQPLVFDAFQGIESVLRKSPGSRKFGLYAVRRLLQMLGGSIDLESTPGKGTTFRVSVPTDVTRQGLWRREKTNDDF